MSYIGADMLWRFTEAGKKREKSSKKTLQIGNSIDNL
jgi:hypothetical protein